MGFMGGVWGCHFGGIWVFIGVHGDAILGCTWGLHGGAILGYLGGCICTVELCLGGCSKA